MGTERLRLLPQRDYHALKAAFRTLVSAAGGPARVGEITRARNPAKLSEACAPHCMDRFPALDVIADLECETGSPIVAKVLADLSGCDLVARDPKPADAKSLPERLARVARESADVTAAYLTATADGQLTDKERDALRREVAQALAELHSLDDVLKPARPKLEIRS